MLEVGRFKIDWQLTKADKGVGRGPEGPPHEEVRSVRKKAPLLSIRERGGKAQKGGNAPKRENSCFPWHARGQSAVSPKSNRFLAAPDRDSFEFPILGFLRFPKLRKSEVVTIA